MPVDPVVADTIIEADWGNQVSAAVDALEAALAGKQPLDADLTAIAAVATTAYGRALLALANQAALMATLDFGEVGDIVASAVGDAAAAGATGEVADAGHRHAREAFGNPVAVGTANAAGASTSSSRAGHTHQLQGAAIQAVRVATGNIAANNIIDLVVTWGTAFADANYSVVAMYDENTGGTLNVTCRLKSKVAASATITVVNGTAGIRNGNVHAIAVHD